MRERVRDAIGTARCASAERRWRSSRCTRRSVRLGVVPTWAGADIAADFAPKSSALPSTRSHLVTRRCTSRSPAPAEGASRPTRCATGRRRSPTLLLRHYMGEGVARSPAPCRDRLRLRHRVESSTPTSGRTTRRGLARTGGRSPAVSPHSVRLGGGGADDQTRPVLGDVLSPTPSGWSSRGRRGLEAEWATHVPPGDPSARQVAGRRRMPACGLPVRRYFRAAPTSRSPVLDSAAALGGPGVDLGPPDRPRRTGESRRRGAAAGCRREGGAEADITLALESTAPPADTPRRPCDCSPSARADDTGSPRSTPPDAARPEYEAPRRTPARCTSSGRPFDRRSRLDERESLWHPALRRRGGRAAHSPPRDALIGSSPTTIPRCSRRRRRLCAGG